MGDRYNRGGGTGRRAGTRRDDRGGGRPTDSGEDRWPEGGNSKSHGKTRLDDPPIITLDDNHGRAPVMQTSDQSAAGSKKKFTGRCRLFIGNVQPDVKQDELKALFNKFGETSECYLSPRGFGFVRLDTRAHAEAAKDGLDMTQLKGRQLRVRFAVHSAALRVKELSPYVSNELLEHAFAQFGTLERVLHIVDDKGRPTGEGIVEFERKNAAAEALKRINEGVFLLGTAPHPIIVEPLEQKDDEDGLPEKTIPPTAIKTKEREQGPRFAPPRSFEHEFGMRFKELYQIERMRREQLDVELREARERLEADMDLAYQDYQTQMMREELRRRQEELDAMESAKVQRMEQLKRRDEERLQRLQQLTAGGGGGNNNFGGTNNFGAGMMGGGLAPAQHQSFGVPPPLNAFDTPNDNGFGRVPSLFGNPMVQQQHGGYPDEKLSSGVQKLMKMFEGGGNGGGIQAAFPLNSADPGFWGDEGLQPQAPDMRHGSDERRDRPSTSSRHTVFGGGYAAESKRQRRY